MSNFARIINGVAIDVSTDPKACFTPELAEQFGPVPDNVAPGWIESAAGSWSAPPAPTLHPPDLTGVKATKSAAVDDLSAEKVAAGFTFDFGSPTGLKLLQTRDGDKPNWLALAAVSTAMIAQGQGSASCGAIRTADNTNVAVTATQALAAMLAMQAALAARVARGWTLKDAIAAAADTAALDAIDITAGWPA